MLYRKKNSCLAIEYSLPELAAKYMVTGSLEHITLLHTAYWLSDILSTLTASI